jgi:hypothetical protein
MKNLDPVGVLAAVNPLSAGEVAALEGAPERASIRAQIEWRRHQLPPLASRRHKNLRPVVIAAALGLALAIPAFALSGVLGSLFGFSNTGTPVERSKIGLDAASSLDLTGATGTVNLLGSRAGIGIYLAHDQGGNLCFFLGPPNGELGDRGLSGGCLNSSASGEFPSPQQPVVDMTLFAYQPGTTGEQVVRLAGVAADGVARMEVLSMDCRTIAEAPVVDNIYATTDVPDDPVAAIVGVDSSGKQVYLDKRRFWTHSTCQTATG